MDTQELELLDGFRRLCPADRNMVMTAVSMVLSAEDNMKRGYELSRKCPICGAEKCGSDGDNHNRGEEYALRQLRRIDGYGQ